MGVLLFWNGTMITSCRQYGKNLTEQGIYISGSSRAMKKYNPDALRRQGDRLEIICRTVVWRCIIRRMAKQIQLVHCKRRRQFVEYCRTGIGRWCTLWGIVQKEPVCHWRKLWSVISGNEIKNRKRERIDKGCNAFFGMEDFMEKNLNWAVLGTGVCGFPQHKVFFP